MVIAQLILIQKMRIHVVGEVHKLNPNGTMTLKTSLIFDNVDKFKSALLGYGVQEGFAYKFKKNVERYA